MRSSSRNIVSTIGAGILGVSYFIGSQTASNALDTSNTAAQKTASPTPSDTPTPSASASSSAAPSASSSKSSGSTSTKTTAPKPAASSSSSSGSSTSGGSGSTSSSVTKSASVDYVVEGDPNVIRLAVTKTGDKITAVDYSGSTATEGRSKYFPTLAKAAVSANGSGFGNISGATYTTDAFKQALNAALAKF